MVKQDVPPVPHPEPDQFILFLEDILLILTPYLRLGLPSGHFPSGFPAKTLHGPLRSFIRATRPAHPHSSSSDHPNNIW